MKQVVKRIKAFAIDYLLILGYIGLLFATTLLITNLLSVSLENIDPVSGQLIGFITLTLPVILYFTIMENKYTGTAGKRKFALKVVSGNLSKARFGQLLLRNCIKFLPWELAHFFDFRLYYFTSNDLAVPGWILTGLIVAQALALMYVIALFFKGNRSVYERLSATRVIE